MFKITTLMIATMIVLSSCAGKFSVMKRKYTKGYYIASSKGHRTTKTEPVAKIKEHHNTPRAAEKVLVEHVYPTTRVPETSLAKIVQRRPADDNFAKQQSAPEKRLVSSASKTQAHLITKNRSSHIKPIVLTKLSGSHLKKDDTSDIKLILLVILCLFWWLDLLAVFIHDNQAITPNFWITLLLDLLVVPGIVFAILVVLNIVDVK